MSKAMIKPKKKFNFSKFSFIFIAVSIPVLHWLVTYVYVHFNSFFMAFQTQSVETGEIIWGFKNFELFSEMYCNLSIYLLQYRLDFFLIHVIGAVRDSF